MSNNKSEFFYMFLINDWDSFTAVLNYEATAKMTDIVVNFQNLRGKQL